MQHFQRNTISTLSFFILFTIAFASKAQEPIVTSFIPNSGPVGTSVTITGNNFNAIAANNIVFLGATQANVQSANATSLTVTVPVGATYQPISVINTGTNLIGNSAQPFQVTFNSGVGQTITPSFFSAKADLTTGNNPAGLIAVADIDGDGKADLVVVNRSTNTFSIFRNTSNNSQPVFAAKVDFITDSTPSSVAIGDLDGDGKPDIVITNMFTNKISVYRNTAVSGSISANSLAAQVSFIADTLALPTSVAIGDLNGDGKPDLAVTNSYYNTVSVLKNISKVGNIDMNSFSPAVDFITGLGPTSVAITDIDGDGKQDLVVSNLNAKTISVFRNKVTSNTIDTTSFSAKVDFKVGTGPNALAIGDINVDGKPDVIVANQGSNTLSILTNKAFIGIIDSTSFASKVDISSNGESPYYVAIGNIDSDTLPDIVVSNLISNNISVIRNLYTTGVLSSKSFASGVNFATGYYPYSASIVDLDGDGKADLVVPNYGKNTISVYQNMGINLLPVSFYNFSGNYKEPGNALLSWKTASEKNTEYYIIQRSNGSNAFSDVGRVGVHGAGYAYSFIDALPFTNSNTKYYYRLQSVDNNSTSSYSNVISIDCNKRVSMTLYPNPAHKVINIKTEEAGVNGFILITDVDGHAVYTNKIQNTTFQQISVSSFSKGNYWLTIFTPSGKQTKQFVVE